jgi:hypothetical protein
MSKLSFSRICSQFSALLVHIGGLPFQLSPVRVPRDEYPKLAKAAAEADVVVIFNGGGWGDFTIDKATDFASVLKGISTTLQGLGYRVAVLSYCRVVPGLAGHISGVKEQLNAFKVTALTHARDISAVSQAFPAKTFLLVGFSVGCSLNAKALIALKDQPNVLGITVGSPYWFSTYASPRSLVLNNDYQDPLSVADFPVIALNVIRNPWVWLRSRWQGRPLSIALCFQFPHHEYPWSSEQVGPPIRNFLTTHLKR